MTTKNLLKPLGKIPAENTKEFKKIINAVIKQWGLSQPVEIMSANRLVSTWMKMRYVESCIKKYGLFFEDTDDCGKINRIRMNELAYYLKQLEADFRSYCRLLNVKRESSSDNPMTFLEMLDGKN